jgi:hypothetical protein
MAASVRQITTTPVSETSSYTIELTGVVAESPLLLLHEDIVGASTISSVTDNAATPYTWSKVQGEHTSGVFDAEVWQGIGGSGGSVTVTVHLATSGTPLAGGDLIELADANPTTPIAFATGTSGSGTSWTSPSIDPVTTGDLVLIFAAGNSHVSVNPSGAGWTLYDYPVDGSSQYGGVAYQSGAEGTAYSATWTASSSGLPWAAIALDIALIPPPLAPTLSAPAPGAYGNVETTGGPFTWAYNSGGATGGATGYHFRRKISGAPSYQYWTASTGLFQTADVANTTTTDTVTFPGADWTVGDTYNWSVASVDAGGVGPYAADSTVNVQAPPTISATTPSGTLTATQTPTVTWTAAFASGAAQSGYRVITYSPAQYGATGFVPGVGPSMDDSGSVSGTATSYTVATPLPNDSSYKSYVFVTQGPGGQAVSAYAGYAIDVPPPGTPSLVAAAGVDGSGTPVVKLTATSSDTGVVCEFQASYDGGVTWADIRLNLTSFTADVATTLDYECPFNTAMQYRCRCVVADGNIVSGWSSIADVTLASTHWWIIEPLTPTKALILSRVASSTTSTSTGESVAVVPLGLTSSLEIDETEQQGQFYAFGRTTAIVTHGDLLNPEFDLTVMFLSNADFETFRSIRRDQVVVCLKSDLGGVYYASLGAAFPAILIRSGDRQTAPKWTVNVHCYSADKP